MKFLEKLESISVKNSLIIMVAIGFIVYFNALPNNFVGDDFPLIQKNPLIHSVTNIPRLFKTGVFFDSGGNTSNNYYKPIVAVTYTILYRAFRANPLPYHLFQVILHIVNSIIIFLVLRKLFKDHIAILLAIIFLIHPANVETVTYIAALQDILFMFFGLLALYFSTSKIKTPYNYIIQILLLTLSLLSKETGVMFIFLVPIFNFLFQKERYKYILTSLSSLVIYLYLRLFVAHIYVNSFKILPIMTATLPERMLNIPKIILFYLKLFFFPKDLLIDQTWIIRTINFSNFYLPLLLDSVVLVSFIAGTWLIYKYQRKMFETILFFGIWLVLGLSIHLQLVALDQTVADRWIYLPMIGMLGILGVIIQSTKINLNKYTFMVVVFVILILSGRTMVRNRDWRDTYTLDFHDIQKNQDSPMLEVGYGTELLKIGNNQEAETHYLKATELFSYGNTWEALGTFYYYTGNYYKAKQSYYKALEYTDSAITYSNLAIIVMKTESKENATTFVGNILKKFPHNAKLMTYDAFIKYQSGQKAEAISILEDAYSIARDPATLDLINLMKNDQTIRIE